MDRRKNFIVPKAEISEKFSASGGAGGQNVNKLATKAEARWNVNSSKVFTGEEKEKIKKSLAGKLTKKGDLIIVSQKQRSQKQNREAAIGHLNDLIKKSLAPKKKRKATKPTRASKERRLQTKKHLTEKKKLRVVRVS